MANSKAKSSEPTKTYILTKTDAWKNHKYHNQGSEIELTEAEAKRFGDSIKLKGDEPVKEETPPKAPEDTGKGGAE